MKIRAFPIKIDKSNAEKIAQAKGSFLWRLVFASLKLSEIRLLFVEFRLITFEAIHRPTIIDRLFFHKRETTRQRVMMLANGSTGSVAWVASMPDVIDMEDVEENQIQPSDQNDKLMIIRSRKVATKVLHRYIGGITELGVLKIECIYRPYWVAFYGNVVEGNKVRYVPIAADGCGSQRSF